MSDFFAGVTAALATMRDGLRERADHLDEAITALQKAGSPMPALAVAAPPAALPSPRPRTSKSPAAAVIVRDAQPTVCRFADCGKPLVQRDTPGRPKRYCDRLCAARARRAKSDGPRQATEPMAESASGRRQRAAPTPAPERKRMPRADRPVDDRELDAILARGKRGAAA